MEELDIKNFNNFEGYQDIAKGEVEFHAGVNPMPYLKKMVDWFGRKGVEGGRKLVSPLGTPEITLADRGIVEPFIVAWDRIAKHRAKLEPTAQKIFKGVKDGKQTETFQVVENTELLVIVAGDIIAHKTFDFTATDSLGNVFDQTNTDYTTYPGSDQTVMIIDNPATGDWDFQTMYEGEIVLDNCAGSFTTATAIACENLNRNWICIEQEEKYCKIGKERIRINRFIDNI